MPVLCYLKAESYPMRDFKKLLVWDKAHELTLAIYRAAEAFESLDTNVVEVKRMLSAFIKTLKARQ